ncbi:hypothetical protein QBC38DRAFT_264639 [Podospora fimiseda]|uniref:receptor protein-tyrosine kinase n=1 Tax=Podospora fimiseda TaxID=252190 RepID=A0AAN7BKV9_9PEZI|nr:hypothetical protein QBC38DRAFT_264639 [Podospora fimiseda]
MAPLTDSLIPTTATSMHQVATKFKRAVAEMLSKREDDKECSPQPGINLCEKPGISSSAITWIIVGVVIGVLVVVTLCILLFLHLRRKKRDKQEDMSDRFQMSDYGLDEVPTSKKGRQNNNPRPSPTPSPGGSPRRSRDPLQAATEPKYPAAHLDPNPFDENGNFPKREISQQNLSPPRR